MGMAHTAAPSLAAAGKIASEGAASECGKRGQSVSAAVGTLVWEKRQGINPARLGNPDAHAPK
jgi:hypothetical protein